MKNYKRKENMTIDEQIKLLERQLSDLRKQKKKLTEENSVGLLNKKIMEAQNKRIKIKSIYVSTEIFNLCRSFFRKISDTICPCPLPFYSLPFKYRGYTVYENINLKPEEIDIAIEI